MVEIIGKIGVTGNSYRVYFSETKFRVCLLW